MEVVVLNVFHACVGVSSDHRDRYTCLETHGDVAMSKAVPSNALTRMNVDFSEVVAVIFRFYLFIISAIEYYWH